MKKILITIIIILLLAIFPLYQLYALNQISIQNFQIHQIEMNNRLQFEVEGSLELYNPSAIPVTLRDITYIATINGEEVFSGVIEGTTIAAKEATPTSFTHIIDWVPEEDTIQEILAGEDIIMIIDTEARVSYLYFFTVTGEKSIKINITNMVKPYIQQLVDSFSAMILGLAYGS
jgi:LEA14-like dessication related protein